MPIRFKLTTRQLELVLYKQTQSASSSSSRRTMYPNFSTGPLVAWAGPHLSTCGTPRPRGHKGFSMLLMRVSTAPSDRDPPQLRLLAEWRGTAWRRRAVGAFSASTLGSAGNRSLPERNASFRNTGNDAVRLGHLERWTFPFDFRVSHVLRCENVDYISRAPYQTLLPMCRWLQELTHGVMGASSFADMLVFEGGVDRVAGARHTTDVYSRNSQYDRTAWLPSMVAAAYPCRQELREDFHTVSILQPASSASLKDDHDLNTPVEIDDRAGWHLSALKLCRSLWAGDLPSRNKGPYLKRLVFFCRSR